VYVINDTALLVSPTVVVKTAYEMLFVTGELYPHLFASSWIFFYGFFLAILAGVPLGFVMALNPVVRDYVNPWMATLYTTPRIAGIELVRRFEAYITPWKKEAQGQ